MPTRAYKISRDSILASGSFLDTGASRAVLQSVDHYERAQGQTLVCFTEGSKTANVTLWSGATFPLFDDRKYRLISSHNLRLSRKANGEAMGVYLEFACTDQDNPGTEIELWFCLSPGWNNALSPEDGVTGNSLGFAASSDFNWNIIDRTLRLNETLLYPQHQIRFVEGGAPTQTSYFVKATLSVWVGRENVLAQGTAQLRGLYARETY